MRTRAAIRAAVRDFAARPGGLGAITAADIATAAGVSRRTYFNHYPDGLAGVLADAFSTCLEDLVGRFIGRPASEAPLVAAQRAVADGLPEELLDWLCLVGDRPGAAHDADLHQQVWLRQSQWLAAALRRRLGEAVPTLYVDSLATTVMSIFNTAERAWLDQTHGDQSPQSRHMLGDLLGKALSYAAHGWQQPPEPD